MLHLTGQHVAQGQVRALRAVHLEMIIGLKQRREKREALDMVPMRVRQKNGGRYGAGPRQASRRLPSERAPVPQSSTNTPPAGVVSSTQDVLPPKWVVPGPGAAMDPRVPQKRACIVIILST